MGQRWTEQHEWLETDGRGGFASGTAAGPRTRRYHALLLAATGGSRHVLVNGLDAWLRLGGRDILLTRQRYAPDTLARDLAVELIEFAAEPWPRWTYRLADGTAIEHELFVPHGRPAVALCWRLASGHGTQARLAVRPFLSGRDYHATHHENGAFRFTPEQRGNLLTWRPYDGVPAVTAAASGTYRHEPEWYRNFEYTAERERGLDDVEDLAAPGAFEFDLGRGEAALLFAAGEGGPALLSGDAGPVETLRHWRRAETRRRMSFAGPLHRAADAYLVSKGEGRTIIAGYPWFTDWGRDTFIALRGLCLAAGRLDDARSILLEWAGSVSRGMLPNRYPDGDGPAEYNAVDASLWFVIAAAEYLAASDDPGAESLLGEAIRAIVTGYAAGTRHGIRMDEDGLLLAGEPGVQLTWMDARVGDRVITPRSGKPVEVQALWLNALAAATPWVPSARAGFERGLAAFRERYVAVPGRGLPDVVDADGVAGAVDATLRPNQVLAVGGLPLALLDRDSARIVVDAVEAHLLTPVGLRSLAPEEPGYVARYEGGVAERDGSYHQGTVWPWLIGPFVEAWLRVHGDSERHRAEARVRFVEPLLAHLNEAGMGHVSEIADAARPHTPRGCPFQAWSVGELLRIEALLAARPVEAGRAR